MNTSDLIKRAERRARAYSLATKKLETRTFLTDPPEWFVSAITGPPASSGVRVNGATALRSTPVWAAIRCISEDLSSLPLLTYRRLPRGKSRAPAHPLFTLLHDAPNPEQTAFEFWELAIGNMLVAGNSINFIELDQAGRPTELWPLRPDQIQVQRDDNGELVYIWSPSSQESRLFPADRILHLKAFSRNGFWGLSPIDVAREAIGLGLATEEYGARFFSNDATPGGVLEHPGSLSKEALAHLRDTYEAHHTGLSQSHKTLILEEGMKWSQTTVTPENAQFLETRKFQVTEVARIFRVPPHKIADMDRATFSNIEEQNIDYVVSTIRPWARRIEARINIDLFSIEDPFFAEFLIDGLLRGNVDTRFKAYSTGRQWGWLSADDVRELENMNPLPEGQGEVYLVPLNMVDAKTLSDPPPPPPPPPTIDVPVLPPGDEDDEATRSSLRLLKPGGLEKRNASVRRRLGQAFRGVFEDAAARIVRREVADVERKAARFLPGGDVDGLKTNLEDFYLQDHRAFVEQQIRPAVDSLAQAVHDTASAEVGSDGIGGELAALSAGIAFGISDRWVRFSNAQLAGVLSNPLTDPTQALKGRLGEWGAKRAGKFAARETVNVEGAISRKTWAGSGITKMRWVAFPPNCPLCNELDGQVVGIEGEFVSSNEEHTGDDGVTTIRTQGPTRHAPLHDGCDCTVEPE